MSLKHPLRPYQTTVARAILDSILHQRGLTFTVEIARQGGARELSAQMELLLLGLHAHAGARLVKVAPTPDASGMDRLLQRLSDTSTDGLWSWDAHTVRLGRAEQLFVGPESAPALHGPVDLLEVAEAQTLDHAIYDQHLRPLASASGATTVLYGAPWNGASWFEQMKEENRRQERRDGLRRHFRLPGEAVARHSPLYAQYLEQERSRLGEEHPWFQSRYCLRPVPADGPLLSELQHRRLQGSHPRRRSPERGKSYVAALHVAQRPRPHDPSAPIPLSQADATVVTTIAEVDHTLSTPSSPQPSLRVVDHRWWQSHGLTGLVSPLVELLGHTWKCQRLVLETPQDQQGLFPLLRQTLGHSIVELHTATPEGESDLALSLLAAVNTERLKLYAADNSPEHRALRHALRTAEAVYHSDVAMRVEPTAPEQGFLRGLLLLMKAATPHEAHRYQGLPMAVAS